MTGRTWLLFLAAAAAAQQPPPAPSFRIGTQLVQVSVIAQDNKGKPVADLRREEFQIFDNGAPREVRLFLAETEKSNPASPDLAASNNAPNIFTNQIASPAGVHSGYSVILIDNLFTDFGDPSKGPGSANARLHALRTLRSIPMGEKIAIYSLQRKLQVICEFTSDRDLLEQQLAEWKPDVDTPGTTVGPIAELAVEAGLDGERYDRAAKAATDESARTMANMQAAEARGREAGLQKQVDGVAHADTAGRASQGDDEMGLVADHLAGIPGRKNLIWLSDNKFVIGPRALQKLKDVSVAIYPVDLAGVCQYCIYRPREVANGIAAETGGAAYYQRNDIDVIIHEAMDDGRVSYTLGFYESGDDHASQIHQIAVRVSRPGVTLRYRTSYRMEPPRAASATTKADLAKALDRPIDATALPIHASVARTQDRLNLQATLDVASLDLTPDRNLWTGKIEVVARFTTADGIVAGDVFSETLTLNLRQTTYDAAVRAGLRYHNIELKIPAKAAGLKLLFANPASGRIGTLTIPLSARDNGVK